MSTNNSTYTSFIQFSSATSTDSIIPGFSAWSTPCASVTGNDSSFNFMTNQVIQQPTVQQQPLTATHVTVNNLVYGKSTYITLPPPIEAKPISTPTAPVNTIVYGKSSYITLPPLTVEPSADVPITTQVSDVPTTTPASSSTDSTNSSTYYDNVVTTPVGPINTSELSQPKVQIKDEIYKEKCHEVRKGLFNLQDITYVEDVNDGCKKIYDEMFGDEKFVPLNRNTLYKLLCKDLKKRIPPKIKHIFSHVCLKAFELIRYRKRAPQTHLIPKTYEEYCERFSKNFAAHESLFEKTHTEPLFFIPKGKIDIVPSDIIPIVVTAAYGLLDQNPNPRAKESKSGEELISNQQIYSWSNNTNGLRDNRRSAWQGKFLANFKRGAGDNMGVAGGLNDRSAIPGAIKAFYPNSFGLYNMSGNVS